MCHYRERGNSIINESDNKSNISSTIEISAMETNNTQVGRARETSRAERRGREPTRRDETREILFARYVHVDVIVRLRCD